MFSRELTCHQRAEILRQSARRDALPSPRARAIAAAALRLARASSEVPSASPSSPPASAAAIGPRPGRGRHPSSLSRCRQPRRVAPAFAARRVVAPPWRRRPRCKFFTRCRSLSRASSRAFLPTNGAGVALAALSSDAAGVVAPPRKTEGTAEARSARWLSRTPCALARMSISRGDGSGGADERPPREPRDEGDVRHLVRELLRVRLDGASSLVLGDAAAELAVEVAKLSRALRLDRPRELHHRHRVLRDVVDVKVVVAAADGVTRHAVTHHVQRRIGLRGRRRGDRPGEARHRNRPTRRTGARFSGRPAR